MNKLFATLGSMFIGLFLIIAIGGILIQALPFFAIPLMHMYLDDFLSEHIKTEPVKNKVIWMIIVPTIISTAFILNYFITSSDYC